MKNTSKKTMVKKYQAGGAKHKNVTGKGPMSGTSGTGKPVTGKTGYIPSKKKGGTAKPKAAYGMAVKPSMMKKGGTKKK